MNLRYLYTSVVAFMAIAACTTPTPHSPVSRVRQHEPVLGTWAYLPSAYPSMCITFLPDGEVRFHGGFLVFNPGRWEREPNASTVRIYLGGTSAFPIGVIKDQIQHRPNTLVAFDESQRLLEYRITGNTQSIDFMNFIFYRDVRCDAP